MRGVETVPKSNLLGPRWGRRRGGRGGAGLPPCPPRAPGSTPLCPRAGCVDRQRPSPSRGPVEPGNRGLGFRAVRHLDTAQAARAPSVPIGHHPDRSHRPIRFAAGTQRLVGGRQGEMPDQTRPGSWPPGQSWRDGSMATDRPRPTGWTSPEGMRAPLRSCTSDAPSARSPLRGAGDGPQALSGSVWSVWRSPDRRPCGRAMPQQDNRDKSPDYSRGRLVSTIFLWIQVTGESCP